MIKVTRLNNSTIMVNAETIQSLQATPDTVITFLNRDRMMVKEGVDELSQRISEYQRLVKNREMIEPGILMEFSDLVH